MRLRIGVLIVALGVPFAAVQAQPEKIDPAKEADIRRLMELTGRSMKASDIVQHIMPQIRASMAQLEKSQPPESVERMHRFQERMMQRMATRMDQQQAKIWNSLVPVYAKLFTHQQIKDTIQFYESPAGRRWLEVMPQIVQESMAVSMQFAQDFYKEVMEELKNEFPELPVPVGTKNPSR